MMVDLDTMYLYVVSLCRRHGEVKYIYVYLCTDRYDLAGLMIVIRVMHGQSNLADTRIQRPLERVIHGPSYSP